MKNKAGVKEHILVCLRCHYQVPQTGLLKQKNVFSYNSKCYSPLFSAYFSILIKHLTLNNL
jgi:hypothetical protein